MSNNYENSVISCAPQRESKVGNFPRNSVLIIEDDAPTADTLSTLMTMQGFTAFVVPTRDHAVQLLQADRFRIILMDYFMPGLCAKNFLAEVNAISPRSAVILMSASVDVKKTAQDLGLRYYIRKPFEMNDLLFRLESIVANAPKELQHG